MKFIDAHHHLWNPVSRKPDVGYKWLRDIGAMKPFGDPTPIQRDYLLEEFCSEPETGTLVGSVHVQADGAIPDPVAETAFIQSISDASGFPIGIVGFVDLADEEAEAIIERHKAYSNFRGVRQILSRLDDRPDLSFAGEHFLRNPRWRDQFSLVAENELSFDLQLYPKQMAEAAEFLAGYPQVPVIIDHAGSPYDQSEPGLTVWGEGMALLAQLPNAQVKLSGFGMFDGNWNAASVQPLIDHMIECFGPEQVMFGSNYPVDKLMRPYQAMVDDLMTCLDNCTAAERAKIFHDNAKAVYRLPL